MSAIARHPSAAPSTDKGLDEKRDVESVAVQEVDAAEELIHAEEQFTEPEYKKLMRKVDMILMPLLMFTYGLQYSDKTSLSAGTVFGLREDTHLHGNEYANLTTWFYVAYAVAQFPMGYLMQRFPLGKALSVSVIAWGTMVLLQAACNNYWQFSIVRVLLGWFESVVTPGFAVLTSSWYLRKEQSLRQGLYFAMNTFFAIVFGLAIYFIADAAEKAGGIAAWRVINLFLGGVTVLMGIILLFIIGTPDEVWWLSKREKLMAKARIVSNSTGGGEQHPWRWSQVKECFKDPQYWMAMVFNLLANIPNGGMTTFNTLILNSFGFNALDSILYGLPAAAVGFVFILGTSFLVRYYDKARFPIGMAFQVYTVFTFLFVGLSAGKVGNWARWAMFCFYPLYTVTTFLIWPLMSVNIAGRTKKTFFAASSLIMYCVGNIVGSQIFIPSDAPKYTKGITGCAIAMCINVVNLGLWVWYYRHTNKKRDREWVESGQSVEDREHEMRLAGEHDLTDRENKHFRYSC